MHINKYIIFSDTFENDQNVNPFEKMGVEKYFQKEIMCFGLNNEDVCITKERIDESYDILVLSDVSYENIDIVSEIVNKFVNIESVVGVVLHNNQNNPGINRNHKKIIRRSLGEKFNRFIKASHIKGSIYYDEMCRLAESYNEKNKEKYMKALNDMSIRFQYDPKLEAEIYIWKEFGEVFYEKVELKIVEERIINYLINDYSEKEIREMMSVIYSKFIY